MDAQPYVAIYVRNKVKAICMCSLRNIEFLVSYWLLSKLLNITLEIKFLTSVKVESVLGLNTKVEAYEILHIPTKIQIFSTLELKDMEFLVTIGLLSNSPDCRVISEFSGMIASVLSLSSMPTLEGTRFYIPFQKTMIFRWWKNARHMFLKFLSTDEHSQCKIHLSPSSLRMVSIRSILISLLSQVEPRCTLLNAYIQLFFNLEAIHQLPMAM
jgi:hypothetical protein